jgi:SAM-dependent methyltransferase
VPREDPAQPDFWEKRFREGVTPWDAGAVPPDLIDFLRTEPARGRGRVLVPGCGAAYEARAFAEAGFDVLALDYAPAAVETARRTLGPFAHKVQLDDFFSFDSGPGFGLMYERAFLCALPRRLWSRYVERVSGVLQPEGRVCGFFYFSDGERGPPFGLQAGELDELMAPKFERLEDRAAIDSIPLFEGKERWQVWQRRAVP